MELLTGERLMRDQDVLEEQLRETRPTARVKEEDRRSGTAVATHIQQLQHATFRDTVLG